MYTEVKIESDQKPFRFSLWWGDATATTAVWGVSQLKVRAGTFNQGVKPDGTWRVHHI